MKIVSDRTEMAVIKHIEISIRCYILYVPVYVFQVFACLSLRYFFHGPDGISLVPDMLISLDYHVLNRHCC